MYDINRYLTEQERIDGIRVGFLSKLAEHGLKPSDAEHLIKSSGERTVAGTLESAFGTTGSIALRVGVPAGVLAHVLHKALVKDDADIKRLKTTRDHYKNVATELENNLIDASV